jgi:hypothetical protein
MQRKKESELERIFCESGIEFNLQKPDMDSIDYVMPAEPEQVIARHKFNN